jgi:hypothetical protein
MVFLSGFNRQVKLGFKQLNCIMHTGEVQCTIQSTVSAFGKNHVFGLGSASKRMRIRNIGFEYRMPAFFHFLKDKLSLYFPQTYLFFVAYVSILIG